MPRFEIEPGSFRDRLGRVFYAPDGVYRYLSESALRDWEALSATTFFPRAMAAGNLVQTEQVAFPKGAKTAVAGSWAGVIRHERIPFISYPYEWSFGQLKDGALLHLELLLTALQEDMILKDSSAFNVQWQGARPVFIDIPSFQPIAPGEPWIGYRQFCQMFLYPLMLQAYKAFPFRTLLRGNIEGIDPEVCNRLMAVRDWLRAGVFLHVFLQSRLQARYATSRRNVKRDLKDSGFGKALIEANARGLRKVVRKLHARSYRSQWSHYAQSHSYADAELELKKQFVREAVHDRRWPLVWDLGCNTGTFSRIAAENADYVVAMDADELAVEFLYRALKEEQNTNILPLVGNVADPSPNQGWRGRERKGLEERGKPALTLALALIHHVVITANVPLKEFVDWLASLGTALVIEFVTKEDEMVQTLLQNKEDIYDDYELGYFEKCLAEAFTIKKQLPLKSETRRLFYAVAK